MIETYTLAEAALILHMSTGCLLQRIKEGKLKAAKPGKKWIVLQDQLTIFVESHYIQEIINGNICQSINEEIPGGYGSQLQVGKEYANLLKLETDKKPRNSMTN